MFFQYATYNHRSFFRKRNEDRASVFYNRNGEVLLALCDGMGGHSGGKEASNAAIAAISNEFCSSNFASYTNEMVQQWCTKLVDVVQKALVKKSSHVSGLEAMGTTFVACLILKNKSAFVINVGDSRAYFCTRNQIVQVTEDQNLKNLMKNDGTDPVALTQGSYGKALYSAIGPSKQLHIDIYRFVLRQGTVVLCSDGLYEFVTKERIHFTCVRNISTQKKAISLVDEALKNTTRDNVTVVLADIFDN